MPNWTRVAPGVHAGNRPFDLVVTLGVKQISVSAGVMNLIKKPDCNFICVEVDESGAGSLRISPSKNPDDFAWPIGAKPGWSSNRLHQWASAKGAKQGRYVATIEEGAIIVDFDQEPTPLLRVQAPKEATK